MSPPDQHDVSFFAMDTYMQLRAFGPSAEAALYSAEDEILRLGSLLSVTDENSEVYAVNNSSEPVEVSEETFNIISAAIGFSRDTGSAFDITIYPVLRAWGFTGSEYRVPDEAELAGLLDYVNQDRIVLDADARTVLLPDGFELDLGGVAKGYAAEKAAVILKDAGVGSALIDLGSSTIKTIGNKPDGSKWSIAVRDPQNTSEYAGVIGIWDGAVSTSGIYERCFTAEDGTVYGHIIDPVSGMPVDNGILSVTVICGDALWGDCLSTALFVMGADDASAFWREHCGFDFIMILSDGRLLMTAGAAEVFAPLGSYKDAKAEVISRAD